MSEDRKQGKMKRCHFESRHKIEEKYHSRGPDPIKKKEKWIRIQFVLKGWIRIRIRSISDRIRNPGKDQVSV